MSNEIDDTLSEIIQKKNNNIETLNNFINNNNNKIYDTSHLINTLNISLENSVNEDKIFKNKLNIIDKKRQLIDEEFKEKNELCKKYMAQFHLDNNKQKYLFDIYSKTILDIINKNSEYNKTINNLLDSYSDKYLEYVNQIDILYPKNYLIQLVSNIILINNNKYKMNILFKEALKDEIINNINETTNIEIMNDKIKLNKDILIECDSIYNLILKLDNENNIELKEDIIKKLADII